MKNKMLGIKEELNQLAATYCTDQNEDVFNQMYTLFHNLYKHDFTIIANSLNTDEWEVQAAYDDTFMNVLDKFKGGDFQNNLSKALKNKRIDIARSQKSRSNRFILDPKTEDGKNKTTKSLLETGIVDTSYSLDREICEKPVNDDTRREIISYLVEKGNDERVKSIVREWLDEETEETNILQISRKLGIPYETARTRLKVLRKQYDTKAKRTYGDVRAYL